MKLLSLAVLSAAVILGGCGKSEEEKYYEQKNKEEAEIKMRQERDSCVRQNRINNTNIDCHKKYPVPSK